MSRWMNLGAMVAVALASSVAMGFMYGDHNDDGTVDLLDYAEFAACLDGPGGGLGTGCDVFDFGGDNDVDLLDFAGLQRAFGNTFTVVIETAPVGNPGNPGELSGEGAGGYGPDCNSCGAVNYTYNIGKYEVTARQYCAFMNAVAATDTYGLYNEVMDVDSELPGARYGCNIKRSGVSGSYTYSVDADWAKRPVNYVSWGDAARFANWLHNNQPGLNTPVPQDENSTEDGAYDLTGTHDYYNPDGSINNKSELNVALLLVTRKPDARWVITSEDEWYKAAYHKNDGATGNYWDYPTASNTAPTSEAPPGTDMTNGSANHYDAGFAIGSPYWRTEVGAYGAKPSNSPYGTFDQGGNVWEWNESNMTDEYGTSGRVLRGGSFHFLLASSLHATSRFGQTPSNEFSFVGFRVSEVVVPEKVTMRRLVLTWF